YELSTSLEFGRLLFRSSSRMGQVVHKHTVNILYTAPTAIRALMAEGESCMNGTTRESLKLLGSVGEPINPEAWEWYLRVIGNGKIGRATCTERGWMSGL